ncbi:aminotransferase class I/II-fold pyridoxal phosphate-dependent enzyme [Dyadobacter sandarakinus]|uniref:Aminotransferase class I/II-fold pyridoxal phosphate-dependent enzyme n=1 Tax=Dyadobacter sandarakinus TaxID=2747268 RepID=A0ABX7IAB1_9BACT|nr:aminotransferase class I/II-fold pyridoxal phosphate-dependent enzyme [Dyadobacter sandarakinus]QRR03056.1 aminotransferase class I/II-fold pyridoxal phosphate-dependent enzyme [Dyadobacter sandarakinus]
MKPKIWLSPPHMGGSEVHYVQEAFESNYIAPTGPSVDAFEDALCKYTGSRYAIATSSGTAAIHLALLALGITRGDIVLCQSLTFCASANPIMYQGAVPVFIDSEPASWNICPNAAEDAILYYIRKGIVPKAIMVVHLYGMPACMQEMLYLSRKYNIPIIEDAAEALGSAFQEKKAGTFGDAGILSFNGNKIITTSGGGALLTDRAALAERARYLASQARENVAHYEHREIGYNYRLSNVCAGIGLGQMKVLDQRVQQRRHVFMHYKQKLENITGISFQHEQDTAYSNRWLTALQIDPAMLLGLRLRLFENLAAENIEARPVWKPMHMQPVFQGTQFFGSDVAQRLYKNGICLPSGSALTSGELDRITGCMLRSQ